MKLIKFTTWIVLGLPALIGAILLINLVVKHSFNNPNIGVITAAVVIVTITVARYIFREIKKENQTSKALASLNVPNSVTFDFDKESAYIGKKSISVSKNEELSKSD